MTYHTSKINFIPNSNELNPNLAFNEKYSNKTLQSIEFVTIWKMVVISCLIVAILSSIVIRLFSNKPKVLSLTFNIFILLGYISTIVYMILSYIYSTLYSTALFISLIFVSCFSLFYFISEISCIFGELTLENKENSTNKQKIFININELSDILPCLIVLICFVMYVIINSQIYYISSCVCVFCVLIVACIFLLYLFEICYAETNKKTKASIFDYLSQNIPNSYESYAPKEQLENIEQKTTDE